MIGVEGLSSVKDRSSLENIKEITDVFVKQIAPLKIILFGSFANGSYTPESDYDFYLVVHDDRNVKEVTKSAYKALINIKKRPVDIVVGTNSRFEQKRNAPYSLMVEGEVERNGILLYDQASNS